MLDIDHFKHINDAAAMPAGCIAARAVAASIKSQLRNVTWCSGLAGRVFDSAVQHRPGRGIDGRRAFAPGGAGAQDYWAMMSDRIDGEPGLLDLAGGRVRREPAAPGDSAL